MLGNTFSQPETCTVDKKMTFLKVNSMEQEHVGLGKNLQILWFHL